MVTMRRGNLTWRTTAVAAAASGGATIAPRAIAAAHGIAVSPRAASATAPVVSPTATSTRDVTGNQWSL